MVERVAGPLPADLQETERWAREQLAALDREYRDRCEPYLQILIRIEEARPVRLFISQQAIDDHLRLARAL